MYASSNEHQCNHKAYSSPSTSSVDSLKPFSLDFFFNSGVHDVFLKASSQIDIDEVLE
jgi:hypothetical protein